ncbi:YlxR family protein [Synechococcus sp. Lug-A]|uniref:YlxR family protein n=1 Tax=unclassified Synechococcus TaxID=2626047 RepID=UPI0020CF5F6C|nr:MULTISPECIES: YlxR family protein [unclassified Synechococcus]MCP9827688.1 YlxR family protein [Synechococcus sp. L2F]MCP9847090.1 YlxR family protein [Synechococcus sp. Lug-A]
MAPPPTLRRCVSCRLLADRDQFLRVIRLAGGGIALDQGMGRSAYLCPTRACFDEAKRRKRVQRALRCAVAESTYAALEQRLNRSPAAASEAR